MESWIPIFSAVLAAYVTPLLLAFWQRLSPPDKSSHCDRYSASMLQRRNNWINRVAIIFFFIGIVTPLPLYQWRFDESNPWPVGLGFGLSVILPVAVIALITLPQGQRRFDEFWRFYALKYNIGIRSIAIVYSLLGLLGIISAYKLLT